MDRAIVLVGVSRTQGDLGRLEAVESAVDRMESWAREQGIPEDRIVRLTDGADRPVTVRRIYRVIDRLIGLDTLEQLIVYFSGHGCMLGRSEFWLLSEAPADPNAAVNLEVCFDLARYGRIPHVVLISDACRTVAKDVLQSRIYGASIFPNFNDGRSGRGVDIFYATSPGAPALELPALVGVNEVYQAVYTEVLCDVLGGGEPDLVVDGFIRPRPLGDALMELVPKDLLRRGMPVRVGQETDARISSGDRAWVARFDIRKPQGMPRQRPPGPGSRGPGKGIDSEAGRPEDGTPDDDTPEDGMPPLPVGGLVDYLLTHPSDAAGLELQVSRTLSDPARSLLRSVIRRAIGEEPALLEPGFILRGREVRRVVCHDYGGRPGWRADMYHPAPGARLEPYTAWEFPHLLSPAQALLIFRDGSGTLLPVFPRCAGIVEFDAEGGFALRYEPLEGQAGAEDLRELRWLRAAVAESARQGVFALEPASARMLEARMRGLRFLDPVLALHAAYAYREIGEIDRILALQDYLWRSLDVRLFDLALLSRDLLREDYAGAGVMPAAPLLSTGWVLMDSLGCKLPLEVRELRQYDTGSLWTHYSPEGVRILEAWLQPASGPAEVYEMEAPRA
ncbi:hypothetical protein JL37_26435 [Achromobacter sp. RTa]|uniref:hypothetical protein n=1 Tax=Achromobacter sp. RTa TaxID=1532557 RepID=UPI00050F0326|nr:hypothetical protein [Achromobacter sp. RTa]KGD88116.1 hypothetical protein JL37_26435 [Achromobacter sp. RTa]